VRVWGAAGAALWLASCAGSAGRPSGSPARWVGAAVPAPISRDQLLVAAGAAVWRGDLWAAQAALTALSEREHGKPDPALDFWSELLALLRCEPITRVPAFKKGEAPLADPWERLRRLVQIERVRLAREQPEAPKTARWLARQDGPVTGAAHNPEVVWPVERERWSDEQSVPLLLTRCGLAQPGTAPAVAARPAPASDSEIALVAKTASEMPPEHPAAGPLLLQTAVLEMARGRAGAAGSALARFDAVEHLDAATPLQPHERNEAILTAALAAVADPAFAPDLALERGRAVFRLDLPARLRRSLALLLSDRLVAANRPDDAAAILGPPPHGDDAIGRYIAFRQVEAHARAGRRAELLAEAREALHRHARAEVDADPALGAVMDMALRTLRASPVSAETMEVLEALGPPRERLIRAEQFAEMALEAGAPLSAMATFSWLYDNEADPGRRLQYLARECVAAAHAGSHADFVRTFQLLAGQEGEREPDDPPRSVAAARRPASPRPSVSGRDGALIASAEAEGRHDRQRAARSVDWQRALLVVARDALTALVDNDDQTDLVTLVATLKRHLDGSGRGPVDEELTTLYRAASAHLKTGPRAYAETVGSERRPILLGDILVGRSYDVRPPAVDAVSALEEVGPLVFVPRRGDDPMPSSSLRRWPGSFHVAWTGDGP
jgi:hypothetical protein